MSSDQVRNDNGYIMTEEEDVGEQLSQAEIEAEINRLIALMRQYNNLLESVRVGGYYALEIVRETAAKAEDDKTAQQKLRRAEQQSIDIKNGMSDFLLTFDEANVAHDIALSGNYSMGNLIILRTYLAKVEKLYRSLKEKGWQDKDLGVVR